MAGLKVPARNKVAAAARVDAPGVRARMIGDPGSIFAGWDCPVAVLEHSTTSSSDGAVTDEHTVVQLLNDDGEPSKVGQVKVYTGEAYFAEAQGPLPGGVPTAERKPGAVGGDPELRQGAEHVAPEHVTPDIGSPGIPPARDPALLVDGEGAGRNPETRP
jgi:hypothetical protein